MDYDYNLKNEILKNILSDTAYLLAVITSIGRIKTEENAENLVISHPMYQVALDVVRAIRAKYPRSEVEMTFIEPHGTVKARYYEIIVDNRATRDIIQDFNLIVEEETLKISKKRYGEFSGDDLVGFLQGVYLSRGRIFLPKEDEEGKSSLYQLEIVFDIKSQRDEVKKMAEKLMINIKEGERRDNYLLYIKDSETISDFLANLKASNAVLELQSIIVERDVRNNANRAVNCSVANIAKSVSAASEQIEAIKIIEEKRGLNSLDEKLKELALLRLNNPDASLNDLAEMINITKSGINHRMRKLMQISKDEGEKC